MNNPYISIPLIVLLIILFFWLGGKASDVFFKKKKSHIKIISLTEVNEVTSEGKWDSKYVITSDNNYIMHLKSLEDAVSIFDKIVKNNGVYRIETVIESKAVIEKETV
jgi:hypothetical protein